MAVSGWWSWALRLVGRSRKAKQPDEPHYKKLEQRGEEIYDEMYETSSPRGYLSEIKECFNAAIDAAEADGLSGEARRLQARLDHIVTVYRRQFS
jgi:hypothetical protein